MKTRTALILAAIVAAGMLVAKVQWYPGDVFDRGGWLDPVQVAEGGRKPMAERLVARRALAGRTRAEVVDMLGEPTPTDKLRTWSLAYHLGPGRPQPGVEADWLVVLLDPSGLVSEARIVHE